MVAGLEHIDVINYSAMSRSLSPEWLLTLSGGGRAVLVPAHGFASVVPRELVRIGDHLQVRIPEGDIACYVRRGAEWRRASLCRLARLRAVTRTIARRTGCPIGSCRR